MQIKVIHTCIKSYFNGIPLLEEYPKLLINIYVFVLHVFMAWYLNYMAIKGYFRI